MPYYSPNPRRRPVPRRYRQNYNPMIQSMRPQPNSFNNQQPRNSRFGNLAENFSAMKGHADTITSRVNMLRQMGSLLSLFR